MESETAIAIAMAATTTDMYHHHHSHPADIQPSNTNNNNMLAALEMSLNQRNQQQIDYYHQQPLKIQQQQQVLTPHSDDDDPTTQIPMGAPENDDDADGKRKISPWHRMKWTDNMVRLLIMVVYYVGDEGPVSDHGTNNNNDGKKKGGSGLGSGAGALQKKGKGKWKSVSKAMMEKGFFVSPQQCEDKFNDLNKRYKRVNDILGKGTSCKVVENPALLDKLDLSPKLKDEVKKLLSSKHLFFREMCAYHNTCGHANNGVASQQELDQPHKPCLHSNDQVVVVPNLNKPENEASKLAAAAAAATTVVICDNNEEVAAAAVALEDENEHEADNEDEDEEDDVEEEEDEDRRSRKRYRKGVHTSSGVVQQLEADIINILQDASKSHTEKREWMKGKMAGLEEQRINIATQSFELEKQRFKWLKFSSKKEREMEREKVINERLNLENERMMLILRNKELDLIHHQLQQQMHHHHHHHQNNSRTS